MELKLTYIDDNDRALGATGMAIGIAIADAENMADGIDIDLSPAEMMLMNDTYWQAGRHGSTAREQWDMLLKAYHATMLMAMGNLLCRQIIGHGAMATTTQRQTILDAALSEGRDECSLDDDEINRLFNKDYNYLTRVFSHSGVQSVARGIADRLARQRHLTRLEMLDLLRPLSAL